MSPCGAHVKLVLMVPLELIRWAHDFIFTGTNVTYKVQSDVTVLALSSAAIGIYPHNITLGPEAVQRLGLGCHQLTLLASNNVTAADPSAALEVCVLELVQGLQASVSSQAGLCPESDLQITVSLDHGAPVQLLFQISDSDNKTAQDTREMDSGSLQVFNISTSVQGFHAF